MEGSNGRSEQNILNFLKAHGSNVAVLSLSECSWKFKFFAEILKCLPKLNRLQLVRTELLYPVDKVELQELRQLETIKIVLSFGYRRYHECLTKPNNMSTVASFNDLLRSQKHIKTLYILSEFGRVEDIDILQTLDGGMPFELEHLSLDFGNFESNDYSNLRRFLETQAPTITSLKLMGHYSTSIYKLVLANFKKLKSLRLPIDSLPKEATFYMQLEPNNSITTLELMEPIYFYWCCSHTTPGVLLPVVQRWFKAFIRCVPQVAELSLHARCCFEAISFMSQTLKELEKLTVRRIVNDRITKHYHSHFPNLVSLCVEDFEVDKHWMKFTRRNPQIRKLTVNYIRKDKTVDIADTIREFIDSIKPLQLDVLRMGSHRLIPISHALIKCGTFLSRWVIYWSDLECWINDEYVGSLADRLVDLQLIDRCFPTNRYEDGKIVLHLERELFFGC